MQKTALALLAGCGIAAAQTTGAPPAAQYGEGSWVEDLAGLHGEANETWPDHFFDETAPVTVAINDTFHLAWDGDVVEYINTTHHTHYEAAYDNVTESVNITSSVMSHYDANITFLPGGPPGTMAVNDTHHITPDGAIVEELNSTHHFDEFGSLTSNIEANLTREYHGLTDEHWENWTMAPEPEPHPLLSLYHDPPPPPRPAGPSDAEIDSLCEDYGLADSCDIRELLMYTGGMLTADFYQRDADFYRLYCKCAMTLRASAASDDTASCDRR